VWKQLQIGTDTLPLITGAGDGLFKFINIDDLERPWTPIKGFLAIFFLRFRLATHILRVNCIEMAVDRPRQPAYGIFSIKRKFQQSKSRPLIGLCRWSSKAATGCCPKSGYGSFSVKLVADRHRHTACHNKYSDEHFNGVNTITLNDFEPQK